MNETRTTRTTRFRRLDSPRPVHPSSSSSSSLSEVHPQPHPCSPLPLRLPASRLPPRRPSRRRRAAPTSSPARVNTTMNCSKRRYVGFSSIYIRSFRRARARHQCASAIHHQSHRAIGAHHRSIDRRVDDARRATTDAGDCARNQPWDFYLETNPSVVASRGVADDGTTPPTTGRRVGRGETLPGFVVGAFPPSFPPHPEEKRIRFSSTFGCG